MNGLGLVCILAVNDVGPVDLFALRRAVQTVAPRSSMTIERRRAPPSETALLVEFDGEPLALHAAPGRIPEQEYQSAVAGNLLWPEAADEMARHRATVTVCGAAPARGPGALGTQAAAVTRLAAAAAEATQACGAHWLGTGAMASPERLVRAAGELERGRWPADLWMGYVALGASGEDGRTLMGARSEGAADFLGVEVELPPFAAADRIEPMRRLFAVIGALIGRGAELADGQTVTVRGEGAGRHRLRLEPEGRRGLAVLEPLDGAEPGAHP